MSQGSEDAVEGKRDEEARRVYVFKQGSSAGRTDMKALLGGKGANLCEMARLGLRVPPGFTITTAVCEQFYSSGRQLPPGLWDEVQAALKEVEEAYGSKFADPTDPLLLSVRSGAAVSMPEFEHEITALKKDKGVQFDVELTGDCLKELVEKYKGVYKKVGKELPADPHEQLRLAVSAVFGSWETPRAVKYREINRISGLRGTAVNVQSMVFGNLNDNSGTGVCFTRNPANGNKELYGEYLANAQGEDVVAGIRTPLPVGQMGEQFPEDCEFTIQDGILYMLQTRNGKRTGPAALQVAISLAKEGLVSEREAVLMVEPRHLDQLLHPMFEDEKGASYKKAIIGKGLPASPGAGMGRVVFTADDAEEWHKQGEHVILVRMETSPEDVGGMHAAEGILTARGGMTSHAAIDGKVAHVGNIEIKEGDWVSINGTSGEVLLGKQKVKAPELSGDMAVFMSWVDKERKLRVLTNADTPQDALVARGNGAQGIGLVRTEHMFFSSPERIAAVRRMIAAEEMETGAEAEALAAIKVFQRSDFEGIFTAMDGLPGEALESLCENLVKEYSAKRGQHMNAAKVGGGLGGGCGGTEVLRKLKGLNEANPMLGLRGCRLGIRHPDITEMQATAILEAAVNVQQKGIKVHPHIMVPLVGWDTELKHQANVVHTAAKEVFARTGVTVDYQIKLAAQRGRATRPDLELGVCGEHGGDPKSIEFVAGIVDYVSCSPLRVPIARLAAAQAAIKAASAGGGNDHCLAAQAGASGEAAVEAAAVAASGPAGANALAGRATTGQQEAEEDDSVRCRLSGICEGRAVLAACARRASAGASVGASGSSDGDGSGGLAVGAPDAEPAQPGPALDRAAAATAADANNASAAADPRAARDALLACVTDAAQRAEHHPARRRDCAWGEDELAPLSCEGRAGWMNLSLTMVDSLSTLELLGLEEEFDEAADHLATHLDVSAPGPVNLFEATIRILGGLLSAHHLSAARRPRAAAALAAKAAELGARMLPAYASPTEISTLSLEWTYLARLTNHSAFEDAPLAVHDRLSAWVEHTGGLLPLYFSPEPREGEQQGQQRQQEQQQTTQSDQQPGGSSSGRAPQRRGRRQPPPAPKQPPRSTGTITLGARADSYYEYLLKQWLLTGKTEAWLLARYVQAMRAVRARLVRRAGGAGRLWYVGEEVGSGSASPKMDHLVCFLPGLLALGDLHGVSSSNNSSSSSGGGGGSSSSSSRGRSASASSAPSPHPGGKEAGEQDGDARTMPDLALAHHLARTCAELYRQTPAGLAPEIAHFSSDSGPEFPKHHSQDVGRGEFAVKPADAHSLLRPGARARGALGATGAFFAAAEAVESFYLLWKATGDPQARAHLYSSPIPYREWAWAVFRALERWARVVGAHPTCRAPNGEPRSPARAQSAAAGSGCSGACSSGGRRQPGGWGADAGEPGAEEEPLVGGGYASLESVLSLPPQQRNKMETFFLSETLKYLFLIFADPPDRCLHPSCQPETERAPAAHAGNSAGGVSGSGGGTGSQTAQGGDGGSRGKLIDLRKVVLNTEAHPLPVVGPRLQSAVTPLPELDPRLLCPFSPCAAAAGQEEAGACPAAWDVGSGGEESERGATVAAAGSKDESVCD
eukprot:scaffold12.g8081.t1